MKFFFITIGDIYLSLLCYIYIYVYMYMCICMYLFCCYWIYFHLNCLVAVVSQLGVQVDLLVRTMLGNPAMLTIKASQCHLIGCALAVDMLILHDEHPAFRYLFLFLVIYSDQAPAHCIYGI